MHAIAAQVLNNERFKLWPEAAKTATHLNNLMPVTIDGVTKTCWEWAAMEFLNGQRIFELLAKQES